MSASPPDTFETYIFDYSRSSGKMRFTLGDDSWTCDDIAGKTKVISADGQTGRMTVRCRLQLDEQDDKSIIAYTWRE